MLKHIPGSQLFTVLTIFTQFSISVKAQTESQKIWIQERTSIEDLESLKNNYTFFFDQTSIDTKLESDGLPKHLVDTGGTIVGRAIYYSNGKPQYAIQTNLNSKKTINANNLSAAPYSDGGKGYFIGQWEPDNSLDRHMDLEGRVIKGDPPNLDTQGTDTTRFSSHATHVAGTMVGDGTYNSAHQGFAPKARVLTYDSDSWLQELTFEAQNGLLVSNHSWGPARGWVPYLTDLDTWFGEPSIDSLEDYRFGFYDTISAIIDSILFLAPYHTMVQASGNDNTEYCDDYIVSLSLDPDPDGCKHYVNGYKNSFGKITFNTVRDSDGANDQCIGETASAKNNLVIGMVDDIPSGYGGEEDVTQENGLVERSSFGFTDDFRIKPDLVASGDEVISTFPDFSPYNGETYYLNKNILPTNWIDTLYASLSGTSMAAPAVSGLSLLLQARHFEAFGMYMRSSTVKALLINSASFATVDGIPSKEYGFGLVNGLAAFEVVDSCRLLQEDQIVDGDSVIFKAIKSTAGPLRITLAWVDPPGEPNAPSLNPTASKLVNDLDVYVRDSATGYILRPWKLDTVNLNVTFTRGDNHYDNVEVCYIDTTLTGTFNVVVRHKGQLQGGSQIFSLVSNVALDRQEAIASSVDAGPDRACPGLIGPQDLPSFYKVGWYPEDGLYFYGADHSRPFANPDEPTEYTCYLLTKCGDTITADTVFVDVEYDTGVVIISQNTTWTSANNMSLKYLIVEPDVTLTLNGVTLKFGPEPYLDIPGLGPVASGILVKPYGRLIVNNSTLTATNGCGTMWGGIKLMGPGEVTSNNQAPLNPNNPNAYVLVHNNSLIEHAHRGISQLQDIELLQTKYEETSEYIPAIAMGGGNAKVENSRLENNFVHLATYSKALLPKWIVINSQLKFDSVLRDTAHYPGIGGQVGVLAYGGDIILHNSNQISNSLSVNDTLKGTGIRMYGGRMQVTGTPNTFSNLYYGINASSSLFDPLVVDKSNFSDNYRGVYLKNLLYPSVTRCTFQNNDHYDVYLYNTSNHVIDQNTFQTIGSASGQGLVIINEYQNTDATVVYNNHFTKKSFSNLFYKYNRGTSESQGLQLICNEYTDDLYDINVPSGPGISSVQGTWGQAGVESSGNLFDGCPSGGSGQIANGEIKIASSAGTIDYYHHNETTETPSSGCFNSGKVSLMNTQASRPEGYCSTNFPDENSGVFQNETVWDGEYYSLLGTITSLESNPPIDSTEWHGLTNQLYLLRSRLIQAAASDTSINGIRSDVEDLLRDDRREYSSMALFRYYLTNRDTNGADSVFQELCSPVKGEWCYWAQSMRLMALDSVVWYNNQYYKLKSVPVMQGIKNDTLKRGSFNARMALEAWGLEVVSEWYPADSLRQKGKFLNPETTQDSALSPIRVYPNPSRDEFAIEFVEYSRQQFKIEVYDLFGRKVWSDIKGTGQVRKIVDLSGHPKGAYILKVKNLHDRFERVIILIE